MNETLRSEGHNQNYKSMVAFNFCVSEVFAIPAAFIDLIISKFNNSAVTRNFYQDTGHRGFDN